MFTNIFPNWLCQEGLLTPFWGGSEGVGHTFFGGLFPGLRQIGRKRSFSPGAQTCWGLCRVCRPFRELTATTYDFASLGAG